MHFLCEALSSWSLNKKRKLKNNIGHQKTTKALKTYKFKMQKRLI